MKCFRIWTEERYGATPFPERRIRVRLFGLRFTLWKWVV